MVRVITEVEDLDHCYSVNVFCEVPEGKQSTQHEREMCNAIADVTVKMLGYSRVRKDPQCLLGGLNER